LAELNALYVDLDYYRDPLMASRPPEYVLEMAKEVCYDEGLPCPTLVLSSGRGLTLLWKHSPVPRAALPRWQACQKQLHELFQQLGSDAGCRDAARVLRLSGTKNSKSNTIVKVLDYEASNPEWQFDVLANEILPLTRQDINSLRQARIAEKQNKRINSMEYDLPKEYNFRTLWEGRLTDLQRLLFLRHNGQLPPGHRDNWLLIASIAMSWLIHPDYLDREIVALAAQVANWSENEARRNMGTVINKAMAAARGEKIAFNGLEVDPRYRFKTQSIIDFLRLLQQSKNTCGRLYRRIWRGKDVPKKRWNYGGNKVLLKGLNT